MKKEIKKDREFSREREFTVVLEGLRSEFKTFGEGLNSVKNKLDATNGKVAQILEDATMFRLSMYAMKDDITKMNGKLAVMEDDIRVIKTDVDFIKVDIDLMKKDLSEVKDGVKNHGKRLSHLEEISSK